MPNSPSLTTENIFDGLTTDERKWLEIYLDPDHPAFCRPTGAAKAAGLSPYRGYTMARRLRPHIAFFLSEHGMDETTIHAKLVELLHCRETKIMTMPGRIEEWELPHNAHIHGVFLRERVGKEGELVREEVTVYALDYESKELQRKALDMVLRVKGMYAADKTEHSGPNGGPIVLSNLERAARIDSILAAARDRRDRSTSD